MEKALIAIIFMYATSFSLFGAQYIIGDVLHITILGPNGQPVKSSLLTITNNASQFNSITLNGTQTARPVSSTDALTKAAQAGFELFQLFTGTYIFNLLIFFGVPFVYIVPFAGIFGLLALRAMIGMIKEFI